MMRSCNLRELLSFKSCKKKCHLLSAKTHFCCSRCASPTSSRCFIQPGQSFSPLVYVLFWIVGTMKMHRRWRDFLRCRDSMRSVKWSLSTFSLTVPECNCSRDLETRSGGSSLISLLLFFPPKKIFQLEVTLTQKTSCWQENMTKKSKLQTQTSRWPLVAAHKPRPLHVDNHGNPWPHSAPRTLAELLLAHSQKEAGLECLSCVAIRCCSRPRVGGTDQSHQRSSNQGQPANVVTIAASCQAMLTDDCFLLVLLLPVGSEGTCSITVKVKHGLSLTACLFWCHHCAAVTWSNTESWVIVFVCCGRVSPTSVFLVKSTFKRGWWGRRRFRSPWIFTVWSLWYSWEDKPRLSPGGS